MEGENSQTTQAVKGVFGSAKKPKKRVIVFAVAGVLVLVTIVALATGFLAITFKTPGQRVVLASQVCASDTVGKYNDAMNKYYNDTPVADVAGLDALVSDISKRTSYTNDSNCVFMKYRVAILKKDHVTAKTMLHRYEQLTSEGQSASATLDGLLSIKEMENALRLISPSPESDVNE